MKRRKFMKCTVISVVGLSLPTAILSCSNDKYIFLNDYIGAKEKLLEKFPHQGDNHFSFYTLEKGDFDHSVIKGNKAYVYCENGEIVGFTITSHMIEDKNKWKEYINTMFGLEKKIYENDYGISLQWQKGNRKATLSSSGNINKNIPEKIFYSEAISSDILSSMNY
ncbi:hypothetical protein [Cellulophaga baltica]|uniref:hypothetical protein n=1 Tax=Cellulophaga baltica TaxID=76594 RepID=UPI002494D141|nr:hypothetical protein [Cellulophaga baltica]